MRSLHLYLLATLLAALGGSAIYYKWKVLELPLVPNKEVEVWTVQARVAYTPRRGPNTVNLQIPDLTPGFAVLDERFVARNYSKLEESDRDGRLVQWAIRRATGPQALYYRATLVRSGEADLQRDRPQLGPAPELPEPFATAMHTVLENVRDASADIATFARELVRRFNAEPPSEEVALLNEQAATPEARVQLMAQMLAVRNIPARVVYGIELGDSVPDAELRAWLQVHNQRRWLTIDPRTAAEGWPPNLLLWSRSDQPVLLVEGTPRANVQFSVQRNLADAMLMAERKLEAQDRRLLEFSLLALPLQSQQVYRVLLMVPIGAFIMLLMRNVVGITTFGTFMPVLIAIAFRDTGLVAGLFMFVSVVGAGLLVRFYLERLKLLLVPRLTAVLIVVVLLMALFSVVSHRLGIEIGLSIALFPMVIMAMVIERMSIAWEERGPGHAMKEGTGSLIVAVLAYLVMSWAPLVHLVFVFPEILLLVLAASLLIGRYSGYRLTELYRFRALARETSRA
ncbi:MAG TPA: UUP1 family membrane protein [Xanthomonadaceae bacterium]|nr:UUP1 family membrane protein [Xanthomonadaceae bacterium]